MSRLKDKLQKIAEPVRPGGAVQLIREQDIMGMDQEVANALKSIDFCLGVLNMDPENPAYDSVKTTFNNVKSELSNLNLKSFI